MPEYLAPGVYTEEISTGPVPIEGVSTSTAGFVGPTLRGPVHPRLVTSWLDFQRWYGGLADPTSPAAHTTWGVRGFFDNGGTRMFMARVVGSGAREAQLQLGGSNRLTIRSAGPGKLDDQFFVRVMDPTARAPKSTAAPRPPDPGRVRITVAFYDRPYKPFVDFTDNAKRSDPNRREPSQLEDYDDVLVADIETVLLSSSLITAAFDSNKPVARPTNAGFAPLTGGTDGAALALIDYLGDGSRPVDERRGLEGLKTVDEVSLLVAPDEATQAGITDEIRKQCEELRDRFGILQTKLSEVNPGTIIPPFTSSYVAIYFPWIRVMDPVTQATLLVPPAGHVAGVYAATTSSAGCTRRRRTSTCAASSPTTCPATRSRCRTRRPRATRTCSTRAGSTSSATSAPTAVVSASGGRARWQTTRSGST